MLNPVPDENSWEYIFFDRQLTDEQIDFALKMKLRHQYTIPELAEREKMSVEDTAKMVYQSGKSTTPDRLDQTWMNCVNLFDAEYNV